MGALEGRHGRGSAGAVTLPVALPRPLRAFKRRGGTGAPIAPPFPKSLRDPGRVWGNRICCLRWEGKGARLWCGDFQSLEMFLYAPGTRAAPAPRSVAWR